MKIENNICQAFDPIMIFDAKAEDLKPYPEFNGALNVSCLTQAYVYIEGIHGKRFLCDYHYAYEKDIVTVRTPEKWKRVCQVFINNLEEIKNTFNEFNNLQTISDDKRCWCKAQAYVLIDSKKYPNKNIIYMCNFHFRKSIMRHHSNNISINKYYNIIDERQRMTVGIEQEIEQLTII